jgi:hypothetical protein
MTPRLNLIAEQAGFTLNDTGQFLAMLDAEEVYSPYVEDCDVSGLLEKFAEMIIHECIHAVEKHNAQAYQVSDPKNISQIIQDHFKE